MKKKLRSPGLPAQNAFAFWDFPANFSQKAEKSISISVNLYYFRFFEYLERRAQGNGCLFIFYAIVYYLDTAICSFLYRLPFRRFERMIGP
ncbi:hypothetical protein [Agrobacterium sp. GD03642]|uniref:Uncharacterized protein n=1 Tax=Agrobacterium fabrum TaxID=1176649 RepID=A0A2W5EQK3_9HYPH|nr:hypothetical protein [Agrobacterium sp. GD03642]MDH2226061.1 hypothetical protein [Agrobacterium sp. GD03642]PZP44753.1 MAG: hypothetical protein DI595_19720 [Agrobacterium fabrum]